MPDTRRGWKYRQNSGVELSCLIRDVAVQDITGVTIQETDGKVQTNPNTVESDIRARLIANDASALDRIWTEHASDLLGYLTALHRSRHDAEDTLQDVFVAIAAKRSHVAAARKLKPYLFRLARNIALNRMKRERRRPEKNRAASDWLASETCADDESETPEKLGRLTAALNGLPDEQRTVLALKFFRDKTLREIGEMLGIPANTAASRMRYGMEKLRELVAK